MQDPTICMTVRQWLGSLNVQMPVDRPSALCIKVPAAHVLLFANRIWTSLACPWPSADQDGHASTRSLGLHFLPLDLPRRHHRQ
eukprot:781088-Alexandrium_andersonii.AAC.1